MDLHSELKKNKQQFESKEISESEYNERQISILNKWSGELKNHFHVVNKSKEMDFYEILQLTPSATEADITSKYRKLALKYHPDKNGKAKPEEWANLLKAYQTLSDKDSRALYDNFGTVSNTYMDKASFNYYVGGELWKPYIGNLEIGLWLSSFIDNKLGYVMSAEQKERRHITRVSSIVRYLQNKLSSSSEQNNPSELESFKQSLRQEAQRLFAEPNGKELLTLLGGIYMSEAEAHLGKFSILRKVPILFSYFRFFGDMIYGFLFAAFKKLDQEEIQKIVWKLSRSEISSIARETCVKALNDKEYSKEECRHFAKSLCLLGEVWVEVSSLK